MFCPTCGNAAPADAAYCSKCGGVVEQRPAPPRGPSNRMIALAAVGALAAGSIAVWSSFRLRLENGDPSLQAAIFRPSPSVAPSLAATPSPAATASPSVEAGAANVSDLANPGEYQTYRNDRFGYSIAYPSNLLQPQGVIGADEGQRFASKDQRVRMTVSGQPNAPEKPLAEWFKAEFKPGRTITYQVLRDNWFVISGFEGDRVFYLKTRLEDGALRTFHLEADRTLQPQMQPITEKIARSFK
jgi:predicted nucleic acid-binding Zn ribbon protein